ncbi:hypothetical protein ACUNV4_17840 [Granulosicoccus sp. 3-233]|uniref:hypothetical protein n=1 Tax=Granulosicoccus sp. 3-233 TaxID=3417969 RepID=UPI003D3477EA
MRKLFAMLLLTFLLMGVAHPQNFMVGQVSTAYALGVQRQMVQRFVVGNYRLTRGIELRERRNNNGNWTLSLYVNGRQRFNYSYNVSRLNLFLDEATLARILVEHLEREKRIVSSS